MPKCYSTPKTSADDFVNNIVININHEMVVQKLNVKEVARKSGIKESTLYMRLSQPGTLRQYEIVAIANALEIKPQTLVSRVLSYAEA